MDLHNDGSNQTSEIEPGHEPDPESQTVIADQKTSPNPAKRKGGAPTNGFKAGKRAYRARDLKAATRKRRESLARAMGNAIHLREARKSVRRMLEIIEGKDPKASVAAFKALYDVIGVKPTGSLEPGGGKAYIFVLPSAGEIPDAVQLQPKQVANLAELPAELTEPNGPAVGVR